LSFLSIFGRDVLTPLVFWTKVNDVWLFLLILFKKFIYSSRSRDRYSRDYGRDYDRDYGRDRYAGGGGGGYRRTHRYADGRDNPEPGPCLGVFGMSLVCKILANTF